MDILTKVKEGRKTIVELSEQARKELIYSEGHGDPEYFKDFYKVNFYEVHITIKPDEVFNLDKFKNDCYSIGVKPMVIELQNREGIKIGEDIGISLKCNCEFEEIYNKLMELTEALKNKGYDVIRVKLESWTDHPLANKHLMFGTKTPGCYLESHLRIVCNEENMIKISKIAKEHNLFLSKNIFKTLENNEWINMITYRNHDICCGHFGEELDDIIYNIKDEGLNIINEHSDYLMEFIVFDTDVTHDDEWLRLS